MTYSSRSWHKGFLAFVVFAAACGGSSSSGSGPSPSGVFTLSSTAVTLAPSEEQYLCWSFAVPAGATVQVVSTQVDVPATGVHHYAVFTSPDPLPAQASAYPCTLMKSNWTLVAGGGVGTPGMTLPPGTALQVAGGSQAILQLHLLNASGASLDVSPVNIGLVESADQGLSPAGVFVTGTTNIDIPAHAADVAIQGGCTLGAPLPNVFAVFPHMHTLGNHIAVSLEPASGAASTSLIDQTWNFGQQGVYPATASAAAGDHVSVTCTYSNPGDTDVHYGESTHDEMCFGLLYYWPAASPSTYCIH
jgi:copper type II ascorbate-dependent monooxygenase-like protein